MIRIHNISLPFDHEDEVLKNYIMRQLSLRPEDLFSYTILRRSLDARKKPDLFYVYTVDVETTHESAVLKRCKKKKDILKAPEDPFSFKVIGSNPLNAAPVIIGSGPAGLFCGLFLARAGYCPIICERGKKVEERIMDVERFWESGVLNPESNVQFGEGGAGTFSDGKLTTSIKDRDGRVHRVLHEFVRFGADPSILYEAKPHIGTDVLVEILKNMRQEILSLGGTFRFSCRLDCIKKGKKTLELSFSDGSILHTQALVLALGNSARDTFEMLVKEGLPVTPKSIAVGFRIEHPQKMIDCYTYGERNSLNPLLPSAPYKLTARTSSGRSAYSFCMCPGGYVVNASSEEGALVTNGMSYHDRASENANSAIVLQVTPDDLPESSNDPLCLMHLQRQIEQKTYDLLDGKLPRQRYDDFMKDRPSDLSSESDVKVSLSCAKGQYEGANLRGILPDGFDESFMEAMDHFDRIIPGFARGDALLTGTETRTSCPIRIERDRDSLKCCSNPMIYPCGEGAGYAGGIMSAASDGIRTAQAIAAEFAPLQTA